MLGLRLLPCLLLLLFQAVGAFVLVSSSSRGRLCLPQSSRQDEEIKNHQDADSTRRSFLTTTATTAISITLWPASQSWAAVGTLPECQDTNVVLQGLTIKVTDPVQKNQMISFLQNAFDFEILRVTPDGSSTWLGFGPEQMSIPNDFMTGVSSLNRYGGHASIHIQYDAQSTSVLYRGDATPPGNNIAYLQLGVPTYRISQMVNHGGTVLDAYGHVNVISPSGLPLRGIVGAWPDPFMFIAINCQNVAASRDFYQQELGFVEQPYPYCRKVQGEFEPLQPKNSVYLAPSHSSMGVLLLPTKQKLAPNPVVQSLNLVVDTPTNGLRKDPSGVILDLKPYSDFAAEEKATRVAS